MDRTDTKEADDWMGVTFDEPENSALTKREG